MKGNTVYLSTRTEKMANDGCVSVLSAAVARGVLTHVSRSTGVRPPCVIKLRNGFLKANEWQDNRFVGIKVRTYYFYYYYYLQKSALQFRISMRGRENLTTFQEKLRAGSEPGDPG